jgi:serine/threonine protein kinase
MNCPDFEYIDLYISNKLKREDAEQFEEHLKDCNQCGQKVKEARENENLLDELRILQSRQATVSKIKTVQRKEVSTIETAQKVVGNNYRVVRKVGQGASGEVFQAIDNILNRLVAVKFLNTYTIEKDNEKRWEEARLVAQLNHPNIATVYHIGEQDGIRYIIMEWAEGVSLTESWKDKSLTERLGIYLKVLDAIAAAHKRDIVHRDIKPTNILVDSSSQVKVLDFGIAVDRFFIEQPEGSHYRGTPAYSSPEQISFPAQISPATDVFSLGIILYQLLTDCSPFPQTEMNELFEAIRTTHPELPSAVRDRVPISLQNICLKALEKNPHRRYADAGALGDEIRRFLRGEKIWSRPSFLMDTIQQEVFYHRQKLKVWQKNDLITNKEFDRLENIYERMLRPADPSIIEARKLSLSQVCLYLGGWIAVLGSFVLFYKTWEQIPVIFRPAPAIAATALMIIIGIIMWVKKDSRLSVGFLATANLLIPITILLTMGQWEILPAEYYPWGKETIFNGLSQAESHLIVGNVQLYISSAFWLAFSLGFLRLSRSSIFVVFSIIAFLSWLTVCFLIAGMEDWQQDITAGRYLYAGIGLFILGIFLDRYGFSHYGWPAGIIGLTLIVACLSAIATSEKTLFGWLWIPSGGLERAELMGLSFAINGIIYLSLASVCRWLNTNLQRRLSNILNWLGPLHILSPLRILDLERLDIAEGHRIIYRILLPIASFGFVFASVPKQMKSFFFSGLGGIATAVHKITIKHLDKYFAWPVCLIITGIIWMLISWLVPRFRASWALKRKK